MIKLLIALCATLALVACKPRESDTTVITPPGETVVVPPADTVVVPDTPPADTTTTPPSDTTTPPAVTPPVTTEEEKK